MKDATGGVFRALANALQEGACSGLEKLDLGGCVFANGAAAGLATAIAAAPCRETLETLVIDGCSAGASFGSLVPCDVLPRLKELRAKGHDYTCEHIEPLMDGLVAAARAGKACRVGRLNLNQSEELDGQALVRVAASVIKVGCPKLEEFTYCGPVTPAGATALVDAMLSFRSDTALTSLDLEPDSGVDPDALDVL